VLETELVPPVRRFLEARGYRVWPDPDGRNYFDIVARRGNEIGLVELKVADGRKVFAQALRRRGYGDWVAVLVPTVRRARQIRNDRATSLSRRVGVWGIAFGDVQEVRPASPLWVGPEANPFPEQRSLLETLLDHLEAGELPGSVDWSGGFGRVPGRRSTKDFRLEEFEPPSSPPDRGSP